MNDKKEEKTLSWEEFKSLGKPEPESKPKKREVPGSYLPKSNQRIRINLEKKGRGGKTVTVIKGLQEPDSVFEKFSRELKTNCGTGGTAKDDTIILQGNHLKDALNFFLSKGYEDTKIAGGV